MREFLDKLRYPILVISLTGVFVYGLFHLVASVLFWSDGHVEDVKVERLVGKRYTSRSTNYFVYEIERSGMSAEKMFYTELPVGQTLRMTTHPVNAKRILPAEAEEGWFRMYALYVGSALNAVLILTGLILGPFLLRFMWLQLWRKWSANRSCRAAGLRQ